MGFLLKTRVRDDVLGNSPPDARARADEPRVYSNCPRVLHSCGCMQYKCIPTQKKTSEHRSRGL